MSSLFVADEDLKLFVPTDKYFYTVDNRPLRELLRNDQAINAELADLRSKVREVATWEVENPTVTTLGGAHILEHGGQIKRVAISCFSPGSADDFVVDVLVNGVSAFATAPDRPVLTFDDADGVVVAVQPNLLATEYAANSIVRVVVAAVQGGTPANLRVDVSIRPTLTDHAPSEF